jgi:hypothetical protein
MSSICMPCFLSYINGEHARRNGLFFPLGSLSFCLFLFGSVLISKQGHVTGKSFSIKEGLSLLSLSFLSFFLSLFEGQNRDGYKYTELISDSCSLSLSSALQFYSSSWYQSLALTAPSLEYLSIIGYRYLLILR